MSVLFLLLSIAASLAAGLPGVALPFTTTPEGTWALAENLPAPFVEAGVAPGWVLLGVEGHPWTTGVAAEKVVARGPARIVQLRFATPAGETVLEVSRAPLVHLEEVGLLPWPDGFPGPGTAGGESPEGLPWVKDAQGAPWTLDTATGRIERAVDDPGASAAIPTAWWNLSPARWALVTSGAVVTYDKAGARERLGSALRVRGFQGRAGDHLALPGPTGLLVYEVSWPSGTPDLPGCYAAIPETCLVAGREVVRLPIEGAREEGLRQLGVACEAGVQRACLDVLSLEDATVAPLVDKCASGDPNGCHTLSRARLKVEPGKPGAATLGLLEYACAIDASGSLGERLRRTGEVGEGCMLLAAAYDRAAVPDRALLSLDQACVLGRAEGCAEAQKRRAEAFALRTVRECEDEVVPLPAACVQLGRLLQAGPVTATKLDDFSAMRRACKLGDQEGCRLLGDYVDRWGIDNPRVAEAEKELLDACGRKEESACLGGAWLLVRHDPRSKEYASALETFHGACERGNAAACIAGAEQRRIGAARRVDVPDQTTMFGAACELNSAEGCAGLGERVAKSRSGRPDAYKAWTRSCDLGSAHACTELGGLVAVGHGEPWPGEQPAEDYLRRGCTNGDPEGCYRLAEDDLPRRGEPPEAAYLLLDQSCDGEFGLGCAELAQVHLDRRTSFDEEIAARHLSVACDNGHYESCKVLGGMYLRGRGVERDRQRARELVQRYSVNARRKHLRFGPRLGYPSVAGGEIELVLPIPVGPALAVAASGTFLPGAGGPLMLIKGMDSPEDPPDYRYLDAGARLYPNNKARGIYVMAGVHQLLAQGGELTAPLERSGVSARLGLESESGLFYTRVEIGIGHYGLIDLHDFDEDESGTFPLIQPTIGFSVGLAPF